MGEAYYDYKYQTTHYGIYCIECMTTNTKYIGQTSENFYRRWIFHKWHLKNNHHSNTYIQNAWNKYGEDSFKFYPLESFELIEKKNVTLEKLNELEQYYIEKYDTFNNGFNLTTGGDSCKMRPLSDEAKRKIGEKNRINMLGKKHSEETKKKMSEAHKGYIKTEEHRKHLAEAHYGSKSYNARYSEDLVGKIRIDYMNGLTVNELLEKYDVKKSVIYDFVNHRTWKHVNPDGWQEFLVNKKRK